MEAVVVDIPSVCEAGAEIAVRNSQERLDYHPADFMQDPLPLGFDLVLECDVGVYGAELFTKIRSSLQPNGRLVIIDQLAEAAGEAPLARLSWALQDSLVDPDYIYPTVEGLLTDLEATGYRILRSEPLPSIDPQATQIISDMFMIEAQI